MDQNATFYMIYQWRALLDEYKQKYGGAKVMMTESYSSVEICQRAYGENEGGLEGAHVPFNFELIKYLNAKHCKGL
jgi:alpha-glucosidase